MLHEFLATHRSELVRRCRAKVLTRTAPEPTSAELEHGVPLFLDQLIDRLRAELLAPVGVARTPSPIGAAAGQHGSELLRRGFTIDQVVHDYGDLVSPSSSRPSSLCRSRPRIPDVQPVSRQRDRRGRLRVRAPARSDLVAALRPRDERTARVARPRAPQPPRHGRPRVPGDPNGVVAVQGATGGVLERSLTGLRDVIDRSPSPRRLSAGPNLQRETIDVGELVAELQVASGRWTPSSAARGFALMSATAACASTPIASC